MTPAIFSQVLFDVVTAAQPNEITFLCLKNMQKRWGPRVSIPMTRELLAEQLQRAVVLHAFPEGDAAEGMRTFDRVFCG